MSERSLANTARDARAVPTVKQYEKLRMLGSGSAWLSAGKRDVEPLLRRGWVTGDWRSPYWQFVRITPEGLHALARAVEKYGLPDLAARPKTEVQVCADCGRDWRPRCRCGGRTYRFETREVAA